MKFGTSQDKPTSMIDLRASQTEVTVSSKYKTQFKIIFTEKNNRKSKLKLKADNEQDRDQWIVALRQVVEQYGGSERVGASQASGGRLSSLWPFKQSNAQRKLQILK